MRPRFWGVCEPVLLRMICLVVLFGVGVAPALAQVTYHGTRAGFNAAAPFTTLVDFEAGVIAAPANGATFGGPLTAGTNNGIFSVGDIPTGIIFWNSCSIGDNLILAGIGFDKWGWIGTGGFPSKVLIPSSDACSMEISLSPPVDAVALDMYAESDDGYRVSVYGVGGGLLDTVDGVAGETSPGFLGMVSVVPISRIEMKAPSGTATGAFEAVDNVAFGDLPIFADGFESGSTGAWS